MKGMSFGLNGFYLRTLIHLRRCKIFSTHSNRPGTGFEDAAKGEAETIFIHKHFRVRSFKWKSSFHNKLIMLSNYLLLSLNLFTLAIIHFALIPLRCCEYIPAILSAIL